MNTSRMFSVGLVISLMVPLTAAEAEKKPDRKRPGAEQVGQILPQEVLEKLDLSAEQKEKVAKLRKDFEDKNKDSLDKVKESMSKIKETMDKARQDKDKEAFRQAGEKMRETMDTVHKLRKDFAGQLSGVLTDEQKNKVEEVHKEGAGRPNPAKPGERPGTRKNPGNSLLPPGAEEKLQLSGEQKDKLKQLQKEFEDKAAGVLTDEQKKQLEEFKKDGPRRKKQQQ